MEKLTLSQWVRDNHKKLTFNSEDNLFSCHCPSDENARISIENGLEDFQVIVANDVLHFNGPFALLTVKTREDFLSLSYYTLCCIADTLHLSAIGGMVNEVERGRLKGILTVDSLGNFLMIE